MGNEDTLGGFPIKQAVPALVRILSLISDHSIGFRKVLRQLILMGNTFYTLFGYFSDNQMKISFSM